MAVGSGYGGPKFSAIAADLENIAVRLGSIYEAQAQLKASIDTWRSFQRELEMTRGAAQGTEADFRTMEKAARNFALVSTYSAQQVANSFYDLASAGLKVNQVLSAGSAVMMLAQSTLQDVGSTSTLMAATMSQYSLQAGEALRISNLFVASINSSLSTLPKLAYAMRMVGPVAAQANLSLEQTVGLLDELFNAGLSGQQAGTALRNVIERLADPMGKANILMENLGVSVVNAHGQMRNLVNILEELHQKHISLNDTSALAGRWAVAGMTQLIAKSAPDAWGHTALKQHIKDITDTGAAYLQATIQLNTLDGALSMATNHFNDLRLAAGHSMSPILVNLADGFSNVENHLRDMHETTVDNILSLAALGAAGYVALRAFSAFPQAAAGVMQAFSGAMKSARGAIVNFSIARENAKDELGVFATQAERDEVVMRNVMRGTNLATKSMVGFATSLGDAVSAGAGLIGLVGMVGMLGYTVYKLRQGWEAAKLKETLTALANVAQERGQSGRYAANELSDNANYGNIIRNNLTRLDKQFPVVANDGGASQAQRLFGAYQNYQLAQEEKNRLAAQYTAVTTDYTKNKPRFLQSLHGLDRGFSSMVAAPTLSGYVDTRSNSVDAQTLSDYFQNTGLDAAKQKQTLLTLATELQGFQTAVSKPEMIASLNKYFDTLQSIASQIQDKNTRTLDLRRVASARAAAIQADGTVLANLQQGLKGNISKLFGDLSRTDFSFNSAPNIFANMWRGALSTVRKQLIQSDTYINREKALIASNQSSIATASTESLSRMSAINNPLLRAVYASMSQDFGITPEEVSKVRGFLVAQSSNAKQLDKLTGLGEGSILDAFLRSVMKSGDVVEGKRLLAQQLFAAHQITRTAFNKEIQNYLATPLIDVFGAEDAYQKAKVKQEGAIVSFAQSTHSLTDSEVRQYLADKTSLEQRSYATQALDKILKSAGATGNNALLALNAAKKSGNVPAEKLAEAQVQQTKRRFEENRDSLIKLQQSRNDWQRFIGYMVSGNISAAIALLKSPPYNINADALGAYRTLATASVQIATVPYQIGQERIGLMRTQTDIGRLVSEQSHQNTINHYKAMLAQGIFNPTDPLSIKLAVKADIAQVELNAEKAKETLNHKFKELFAQLGITNVIEANGKLKITGGIGLSSGGAAGSIGSTVSSAALGQVVHLIGQLETGGMKDRAHALGALVTVNHVKERARGKYQVLPTTAASAGFDPSKLFDPTYEHTVTSHIVQQLSDQFHGNLADILMAYFGGTGAVTHYQKTGRMGPKTQQYLQRAGFSVTNPTFPHASGTAGGKGIQGVFATLWQEYLDQLKQLAETTKLQATFLASHPEIVNTQNVNQFMKAWPTYGQGAIDKNNLARAQLNASNASVGTTGIITKLMAGQSGIFANTLGQEQTAAVANFRLTAMQKVLTEDQSYARTRQTLLGELQLLKEHNGSLAEIAKKQEQINTLDQSHLSTLKHISTVLAGQVASVGESVTVYRQTLKTVNDALTTKAMSGSGNTQGDIFSGLEVGANKAAMGIKTGFEIAANASQMAITSLADAGSAAMLGLSGNFQGAISKILMNVAQMIVQMILLRTILWSIGMVAGGSAGSTSFGNDFTGGGSIGFAAKGGIGHYAGGGAHSFGAADLFGGGVRNSGAAALAIFGEGQYPEAFIPMLDHRSIQVAFDGYGKPFVPLPSGGAIPVTMGGTGVRKFASGGVIMPWSSAQASLADSMAPIVSDNVINSGSSSTGSGGNMSLTNTYHMPITVQVQGSATAQDSTAIAQAVGKHVKMILDNHTAEIQRQYARSRGLKEQWRM
jgi:TP901 family phage tail tape measure protein